MALPFSSSGSRRGRQLSYIPPIGSGKAQGSPRAFRRGLLLAGATAAAAALVIVLAGAAGAGSSRSHDPGFKAAVHRAMRDASSGCPKHPPPFIKDSFPEPEFRRSHNGVLTTKLTADVRNATINGQTYKTSVYNGSYPGPTLMLCPGDRLNLTLENHLKASDFPGFDEEGMAGMTNI